MKFEISKLIKTNLVLLYKLTIIRGVKWYIKILHFNTKKIINMNCGICRSVSKYSCNCVSPRVFICNHHVSDCLSGPTDHLFRILKNTNFLSTILKDLSMLKTQIKTNSYKKINKILEQANNSVKEITSCMNNLKNYSERKFDICETNILKLTNRVKSLKFVNFEDLENKYFYTVLQEDDGIYKGIIGLGQDDVLVKEGKGIKVYKDGREFEGK